MRLFLKYYRFRRCWCFPPITLLPSASARIELDLNIDDDQGLNSCELKLIVKYPSEAWSINSNANEAEAKTKELFGFNGQNDCSDAFRHAYFNMLNTIDIGADISRKFGEAHECDSDYPIGTEMDLYNNNIGIDLALSNPQVSESILLNLLLQNLYNGEMKILSNLDANSQETKLSTVISSESCGN